MRDFVCAYSLLQISAATRSARQDLMDGFVGDKDIVTPSFVGRGHYAEAEDVSPLLKAFYYKVCRPECAITPFCRLCKMTNFVQIASNLAVAKTPVWTGTHYNDDASAAETQLGVGLKAGMFSRLQTRAAVPTAVSIQERPQASHLPSFPGK